MRGTLEILFVADPRESGGATQNPPRCVCTLTSNEEMYLLRDYRHTVGVQQQQKKKPFHLRPFEVLKRRPVVTELGPNSLVREQSPQHG